MSLESLSKNEKAHRRALEEAYIRALDDEEPREPGDVGVVAALLEPLVYPADERDLRRLGS